MQVCGLRWYRERSERRNGNLLSQWRRIRIAEAEDAGLMVADQIRSTGVPETYSIAYEPLALAPLVFVPCGAAVCFGRAGKAAPGSPFARFCHPEINSLLG